MEKIRIELPEKWFIIPTTENIESLGKWRTNGHFDWIDKPNYRIMHAGFNDVKGYAINITASSHFHYLKYLKECTEITFEEFQRLVLEITPTEPEKSEDLSYLIALFQKFNIK